MNGQVKSKSTVRRYSPELRERAVRMVLALREETGARHGSVQRVAAQLDVGVESLRSWVRQHDVDHGERPGITSVDAARIRELEQDNKELRRANSILRSASAFFAAELDRPAR